MNFRVVALVAALVLFILDGLDVATLWQWGLAAWVIGELSGGK